MILEEERLAQGLSIAMFSFLNKLFNRIKLLHMEPDGLVLYSKLLAEGTFRPPKTDLVLILFRVQINRI